MKIAVLANDHQWKEINLPGVKVDFYRMSTLENIPENMDACILLQEELPTDFNFTSQPIFVNSVCTTLKEMEAAPHVIRINGWNGFLARPTWEVAGAITEAVKKILRSLGKNVIEVPDTVGLVSARIIALIINEAYFTLENKISTIEEINIAMKLGTNYPFGPFEWATIIGTDKILYLLQKMCIQDKRYLPSSLLKAAIKA